MAPLTELDLLTVWETAAGQPPVPRALTLAAAASGRPTVELAELPLGRRDALLLTLREECFGEQLCAVVSCPSCAQRLELQLRVADLRIDPPAGATATCELAGVDVTYRAPTSRDLLALDHHRAGPDRRQLVAGCVLRAGPTEAPLPVGELTDDLLDALAGRLGELDQQADIVLDLTCSGCGQRWDAPFDIAGYLWAEVDAYARRLLHEVHTLAGAYGWSEAEVLAVGPVRRRFYLEVAPG